MKTNPDTQPDRAPTHRRYWLDEKNQPQCADCWPPAAGVAVIEVAPSTSDERYEREERLGIREG